MSWVSLPIGRFSGDYRWPFLADSRGKYPTALNPGSIELFNGALKIGALQLRGTWFLAATTTSTQRQRPPG
jgi:hypothetical protein